MPLGQAEIIPVCFLDWKLFCDGLTTGSKKQPERLAALQCLTLRSRGEKSRCLGQDRGFVSRGESTAVGAGNLIWDVSQTSVYRPMVLFKVSGGILAKNWEVIFKRSCMRTRRKEGKLANKRSEQSDVSLPELWSWCEILQRRCTGWSLGKPIVCQEFFFFKGLWSLLFPACFSGPGGRPAAEDRAFFLLGLSESREGYSLVLQNVKGACGNSCLKAFWTCRECVVPISCRLKKF